MAGTTISSSVTAGVTLTSASQNPVTVTSAGTVSVAGSGASAIFGRFGVPGTVANDGLLAAANGYGILLLSGGSVTNGSGQVINGVAGDTKATISGAAAGVQLGIHGPGTVANFATITGTTGAGVLGRDGGTVANGSVADTVARISGAQEGVYLGGPAAASVTNFGTIAATGATGSAVLLRNGGSVVNGSAADTKATLSGGEFGIDVKTLAGTVTNFGTIEGVGAYGRGIVLEAGGSVTNGSNADTKAVISGSYRSGVYIGGVAAASVANFGTITGAKNGVALIPGGTVTNGSATDTKATISGTRHGIYMQGAVASSVANFGTVTSTNAPSISLYLGGNVTNGSTADSVALIAGSSGVYLGGSGTVSNFATITGTAGAGVKLLQGGTVINGSTLDKTASIIATGTGTGTAGNGIYCQSGPGAITNFGTVSSAAAAAVHLTAGGTVINGSAADTTATIRGASGHAGINAEPGTVTVTNYGTITGGSAGINFVSGTVSATATVVNAGTIGATAGNAINFGTGNDRLVVDPGAVFIGTVAGGGGSNTLELAPGAGTIANIGSAFSGFGTVVADTGASWTLSGSNTTAHVVNNGTVSLAAAASLDVTGAVDAASTGIFRLDSHSVLDIAADTGSQNQIKFLSASGGELIIDTATSFGTNIGKPGYAGPLIENFVAGDTIDLKNVAGASLSLNDAGGVLQVAGGGTALASLRFDTTTLGSGTFQATAAGSGTLITLT